MSSYLRRKYRQLKYYLISKFIVKVTFTDKKNLRHFEGLRTIYKVHIANSEDKKIFFVFKADRRQSLPFLRTYVIEAHFDETLTTKLRDIGSNALITVVCVRIKIPYKMLCMYLIDRYLDEAAKFHKNRE